MRRFALPLTVLAIIAAACSGGGKETGDPAAREQELRETVEATFQAFLDGDADTLYENFSEDFRDRCDEDDFKRIMGIAALFLGEIEAEIRVIDTEIDGDRATVTVEVETEEEGVEVSDGSDDDFLHNWVYEDGGWKTETDEPDPCSTDSIFGADDGEGDAEPTGPGVSRAEAVEAGETVSVGGVDITVLDVDTDAAAEVAELSEFAELQPGNRFVLLRVRAEYTGEGDDGEGEEETRQISSSDFKLTGSRNVVYDAFDAATSCGFLDEELSGEMFVGGELEGYVCFQAPEDESGLILVVEPFFSFGDGGRRYIALE